MSTKLISVITVCKDSQEELLRTIESVKSLEGGNYEYIVVDGYSKDGTKELLQASESYFKNKGIRFHWVSEKDQGTYDAMNKGVQFARGEYLLFMNAGDYFYSSQVIMHFQKAIQQDLYDAYYGDTLMEFYEGKGIYHEQEGSRINSIMPFIHQSVIVRRSLLIEHPFDLSYRIVADLEFFSWMRKLKKSFKHCNFVVSHYNAKVGLSANNPLRIVYETDRLFGKNHSRSYWIRKLWLKGTVGLIQPIKNCAPRWLLNFYFRKKKRHIIWIN